TWFPDEQGERQPLRTLADWEKRRAAILAGFEEAAGPLPDRQHLPDLGIEISETQETATYHRHTLSLQAEAGDRLTAYLYVPLRIADGEKRPGIVALHPTNKIGKGVVDGQSERPNRAYGK